MTAKYTLLRYIIIQANTKMDITNETLSAPLSRNTHGTNLSSVTNDNAKAATTCILMAVYKPMTRCLPKHCLAKYLHLAIYILQCSPDVIISIH
jgi:hypothetical protein